MDFKIVITKLIQRFDESKIQYGLIGGFALGLWGVGRSTVDLDFLIDRGDLDEVDAIMKAQGYECRFRSENVTQYVSPVHLFGEIDFLHAFRQASLEMLKRAEKKEAFSGGLKIRVLLPEDLIGLKLQAIKNNPSRKEADMADIKALAAIRRGSLDWGLIREYAALLDAQELLEEVVNP
jgi:hypothetical protein